MRRETQLKLALLLFSVGLLLFIWSGVDFNSRSAALQELQVSQAEYQEVTQAREPRETPLRLKIQFNEVELTFDEGTRTFYYPLTGDTKKAYNPIVGIQADNETGYQVAVLGEPITPETIRANEELRVVVYGDGWYEEFAIVTTPLPILSLQLDDPISNPDIGNENKDALMILYDTEPATPSSQVQVSRAQVRWRGASSRIFPQKQIRLSLKVMSLGRNMRNNHLSLLGMREDDDWILYAPYNDPEKMRNLLSNRLWYDAMASNNRFDMVNGTHGKYVEVFVNGDYRGIYVLMHPLDTKQLLLSQEEDPRETDYYYRLISNLGIEPEQFQGDNPSNVIGPVELRFPEKDLDHQVKWQPLLRHYEMMHNYTEEAAAYLEEYTDVENQIDYWLFYILTNAYDNDTKNRNYIAKWDGEKHVILESPWDLDLTWGNVYDGEEELRSGFHNNLQHIPELYPSLISNEINRGNGEIIQHVIRRYEELRDSHWSEANMEALLAELERDVYGSGAAIRHHERWPMAAHTDHAEAFRERVLARLHVMDDYIYNQLGGGQ